MSGELKLAYFLPMHSIYGQDGADAMYKCCDCGTEYPFINERIRCNGHEITLCPWCREDSKPWTNGRGE